MTAFAGARFSSRFSSPSARRESALPGEKSHRTSPSKRFRGLVFARVRRGTSRPSEHRRRALQGPQCGVMSVSGASFEMYALPNAQPEGAPGVSPTPPPKHPSRRLSIAAVAAGNASQLRLSFTPFRYRYTADQSPPLRTAGSNGANTTSSFEDFLDLGANIGMHSRFLFEADRYPSERHPSTGAELHQYAAVFDRQFGRDRNRSATCADKG